MGSWLVYICPGCQYFSIIESKNNYRKTSVFTYILILLCSIMRNLNKPIVRRMWSQKKLCYLGSDYVTSLWNRRLLTCWVVEIYMRNTTKLMPTQTRGKNSVDLLIAAHRTNRPSHLFPNPDSLISEDFTISWNRGCGLKWLP